MDHDGRAESAWYCWPGARTSSAVNEETVRQEYLQRYVAEFAGRHNIRLMDTLEQMASMVLGTLGKRLRYKDLTGRA